MEKVFSLAFGKNPNLVNNRQMIRTSLGIHAARYDFGYGIFYNSGNVGVKTDLLQQLVQLRLVVTADRGARSVRPSSSRKLEIVRKMAEGA